MVGSEYGKTQAASGKNRLHDSWQSYGQNQLVGRLSANLMRLTLRGCRGCFSDTPKSAIVLSCEVFLKGSAS